MEEFLYYADLKDPENFHFVVLRNKIDLASERRVNVEEATRWCEQNGKLPHFETSAKDAVNVNLTFVAAIRRMSALSHSSNSMKHQDCAVDLKSPGEKGGGCCA